MLTHLTLIVSHHCTDDVTEVGNSFFFFLASIETS